MNFCFSTTTISKGTEMFMSIVRCIPLRVTNFRVFRGFLLTLRKLIPAKNLLCSKPRNLIPSNLVKKKGKMKTNKLVKLRGMYRRFVMS